MSRTLIYEGKNISYSLKGEAEQTLVFIHGYLEYKEIWKNFTKYFEKDYRILCVDLPGHGESENLSNVHEMKHMAKLINTLLNKIGVDEYVLIGHSMGGYISLAYIDLFPNSAKGLVLFSSSALNDSTEKLLARNRDIDLVNNGNKNLLINNNIPNMFASKNLVKFTNEIEKIKAKVNRMSNDGIIAALEGMKIRLNYSDFLKNIQMPILFVAGKQDNLIQIDVSERQVKGSENIIFKVLNNSGHMGYVEEEALSADYIKEYLKNIFKK